MRVRVCVSQDASEFSCRSETKHFACHLYGDVLTHPNTLTSVTHSPEHSHKPIINFNDILIEDVTQIE